MLYSSKKGKMVDWRRNIVQQLLIRDYSQWDVAEEIRIDQSTVSRDIQYLRQQAQENLQKPIQQKLPEEYQQFGHWQMWQQRRRREIS
jgi:predicted transcriptional regulator